MRNPLRHNPLSRRIRENRQARENQWQKGMMYLQLLKQLRDDPNSAAQLLKLGNKTDPPKSGASQSEMLQAGAVSVWVYAAMNVTAEKSSTIPWRIVNSEGEPIENDFLSLPPNELQSWSVLRQLRSMHLDLTGNAYWLIDDSNGRTRYWALKPNEVRIVVGKDTSRPSVANHAPIIVGYAFKAGGFDEPLSFNEKNLDTLWRAHVLDTPDLDSIAIEGRIETVQRSIAASRSDRTKDILRRQLESYERFAKFGRLTKGGADDWIPIPKENIIRFTYPHPFNDWYGLSPIQPLIDTITTDLRARQWNLQFFENGALPPILLSFGDIADQEEFESKYKEFENKHKGKQNWWRPFAVGGAEISVTPLPNQHQDLDFLNLLNWSKEDILAALNVPPVMVGAYNFPSGGGSRSAGAKEQRESFWKDNVFPKETIACDAVNLQVDFGEGNHLDCNFNDVDALRPDPMETAKGAKDALLGGLTLTETRRIYWSPFGVPEEAEGEVYLPASISNVVAGENGEPAQEQSYVLSGKKKRLITY